MRFNLNI